MTSAVVLCSHLEAGLAQEPFDEVPGAVLLRRRRAADGGGTDGFPAHRLRRRQDRSRCFRIRSGRTEAPAAAVRAVSAMAASTATCAVTTVRKCSTNTALQ
jgi:hypothetical protein